MYNAKELKLTVRNMQFDYITFGNGDKPLVMIQGLNTRGIKGSALPLAYMYRIFAKEYKVYLFERRPVLEENITVKDMAKDITACMDALSISNAYVLGVSQGGMIAQYLAIERPDLVKKLVLAVTISQINDTVTRVIHSWIDMAKKNEMKQLVTDMAEKMYSNEYIKRYRLLMPLLTLLQKPNDVERFITLAKSCLTCDTYDILDMIHCPVLVIGGKQDKVVGGDAATKIADKLNCKAHIYENLGHAAYEEARDFNKIVYDFFSGD